jgi:transposase-like protein
MTVLPLTRFGVTGEINAALAAASLREGLHETLTVMRFGLPDNLERVLSSTNLIENLFSRIREIGRRVRHWQSGTMVLRWSTAGVLEAERSFRKVAAIAQYHSRRRSARSRCEARSSWHR